jgi:hypothetical protein
LFLCLLFHRLIAITAQTMMNKLAPVTPTAIAATFNVLPGFVTNGPADVSVEELALVGDEVNEKEESVRGRSVDS